MGDFDLKHESSTPLTPTSGRSKLYFGPDGHLKAVDETGAVFDFNNSTSYTDEQAQDAVGGILQNSANINLTYLDGVPEIIADLTATGVASGTYGDASHVASFNVDTFGRLHTASQILITPAGIGAQPHDSTLDALASFNTNGIMVQTAPDTFAGRTLIQGAGITITNPDGISGNITIASNITQYTDEQAQDAVGNILTDTATIDFTYNDVGNLITADLKNTSVAPGSYGLAASVPTIAVDAQGRITSAVNTPILITSAAVSDFNEAAQDAVGTILTDTSSVDFTYNDAGNTISAVVLPAGVDHNLLQNYVADQHVAHSGVTITAGTGLTGGGTIAASRTIALANTTVTPGTYADATHTAQIAIDAQGRITSATSVAIALTSGTISDFNEAAQDAVGGILSNTATINLTYNDAGNLITADVNNASITNAKLAALSVATANLIDASVTNAKLAALSVATGNLIDASVTNAKLALLSVATGNLVDASVTNAKLGLLSVATGNLQDNSVTTAKHALVSVDSTILADDSVITSKILNLNVTTGKLANNAVTTGKLALLAVDTTILADNSVTTIKIANSSVDNTKLALLSVATGNLIDQAVSAAKILNSTITDAQISGSAAIAFSKMASLTNHNRVLVSDNTGVVSESSITTTTLNFLDATSSIQTQLNARVLKAGDTMTGTLLVPRVGITAVDGTGYVEYLAQSTSPAAPATGYRLHASPTNKFSWMGANGFLSILNTIGNTANRTYLFPDASVTLMSDPTTTLGDLIYRGASTPTNLAIGSNFQHLGILSGLPAWVDPNQHIYGSASDGDLNVTGTVTLSQNMYYGTLTWGASGSIITSGYSIHCKVLDLSGAPAGAITGGGGSAGGNATTQTGGAAGTALAAAYLGGASAGTAGTTGTVNAGTTPAAPGNQSPSNGGNGGFGGKGGSGNAGANAGGARRAGSAATLPITFQMVEVEFVRGGAQITGGAPGAAGSSGGGDGAVTGGGGGGSPVGGGVIVIYAEKIITNGSTAVGAIRANGGVGGNGGKSAPTGQIGGGGAGGGAGGGYVYLCYNVKSGGAVTNLITCDGGNGGVGGAGAGTGLGGDGGFGGDGGYIDVFNPMTLSGTHVVGTAGNTGGTTATTTGGTAGAGGTCRATL